MTQQLIDLEKDKWNGIWARIINNFLITAELGRFEIIIGNPPWIDWKNLPSGYRERIKSLCIDKNLFSGDHRTGGINLNVCALIASVSIENWLNDGGKLAFLMPKVIAFQQSYDGYRKFRFGNVPRDFLAFYDWSRAGHPFYPITERFMTFVIGPKEARNEIIPVKCYIKKKGARIAGESHLSFTAAMERLIEKDQVAHWEWRQMYFDGDLSGHTRNTYSKDSWIGQNLFDLSIVYAVDLINGPCSLRICRPYS